ncbi:MAG: tail fiber domain-containing protein [Candidatus Gastranaerophilales bacterium]|nr:tail fiber domain-containing protein [Candidatus Gastranaerophilales bacterium]
MIKRQGFTLAEALITMVIISLVMAATMPIVLKSKNSPSEAPFKYITQGALVQNAAIYAGLGNTSTIVLGDKRVPIDSSIATTDQNDVFGLKLNPKISIITRNRASGGPVVRRHLLDFYEKETNGNYTGIGKISFDRYYNTAIGINTLASIKSEGTDEQQVSLETGDDDNWNEITTTTSEVPEGYSVIDNINYTVTKGAANTAIGQYSMGGDRKIMTTEYPTSNMTGSGNTALGAFSLRRIQAGNLNTGVGIYALQSVTTSSKNTGIGAYSLKNCGENTNNTAVGAFSMVSNSGADANWNTAVGSYSLYANTSGHSNTAIGCSSLRSNTTANGNTAVGTSAMRGLSTGGYNTAVGLGSLQASSAGVANTAIGYYSQNESTTGQHNTSLGYQSLQKNTTGDFNIAIGNASLQNNTTGNGNIVIGSGALSTNASGSGNIIIGNSVALTEEGSNKLYIGGVTSVSSHTISATNNTSDSVLIFGDMSSSGTEDLPLIQLNTKKATIGNTDDSYTIVRGKLYINSNTDGNMVLTKSDVENYLTSAVLNAENNHLIITAPSPIYSDARLKNIIGDNTAGLKEILQLKVKNYTMKRDKKKEVLVGVIAQELQKVFPNSVSEGRDGYLRIRRDEIFYACVNAIKELHAMVQDIFAKIAGLDEKIRILEDRNKVNEDKIAALERQNKLFEERLAALENSVKADKAEKKAEKALLKKTVKEETVTTEEKTEAK